MVRIEKKICSEGRRKKQFMQGASEKKKILVSILPKKKKIRSEGTLKKNLVRENPDHAPHFQMINGWPLNIPYSFHVAHMLQKWP